jgi:uncharacterized membrane protein
MQKLFHIVFRIGVVLKGIDAALETIGGMIFLVVPAGDISQFIVKITQYQLMQNPHRLFERAVEKSIEVTNSVHLWAGLFLLSHGLVKLLIVTGMILKKLWAYRLGLLVFIGLVIYQIAHVLKTHSAGLLILTVVDVIFILLAWREYRQLKQKQAVKLGIGSR